MIRQIIHIDEEKCNGCGACANACHEGAIAMVEGKAKLMRDDYCDGLGDCLPGCPTGAISFVNREAAAYDEAAVLEHKKKKMKKESGAGFSGCPGSMARTIVRQESGCPGTRSQTISREKSVETKEQDMAQSTASADGRTEFRLDSELTQWPVQIKLAPVNAPYFAGANLLIAADCTAYAYGNFHREFIRNRITLIGCPKLDEGDYSEKLTEIIASNDIKSVTIVRMEVPCCGGLEMAAKKALQNSGKFIPWQVVTISTDGRILD